MSFNDLKLHPSLLKGIKDLGFARPTPIQADAIPPALDGRDLLACAQTGSGKTAAFLLPILHQLIEKPRGTTRALVLTPTRELAAQILEDLNDLAVHTPITGAAVFGGVGMGPQEHAFRSGVDVHRRDAGPAARSLPRALREARRASSTSCSTKPTACSTWASCRTSGASCATCPTRRQTLFFSATMPPPIAALSREMLRNPATINLRAPGRRPAVGITQAVYPVPQDLKPALLVDAAAARRHAARRSSSRGPSTAPTGSPTHLVKRGHQRRAHSRQPLAGAADRRRSPASRAGRYRVLVATDIAARGIDVDALGHVVNFDVPLVPEDYIHRVGRTARAEATGDAFTFVSPGRGRRPARHRAGDRHAGCRASRCPTSTTTPSRRRSSRCRSRERIAEIRARKRDERARAAVNAARRSAHQRGQAAAGGAAASPPVPTTPGARDRTAVPSRFGGPRRGPGGSGGRSPR